MKKIITNLPRPRLTVKRPKHLDNSIRIKLDEKTIVTIQPSSLQRWLDKYPNATII